MTPPRVFISYSHDTLAHMQWIRNMASDLRARGIDAVLDQWDLSPGQDVAAFMQRGISDSDRVVMVCTELYVQKAEQGSGGVGFERLIVTSELVQNIDTLKFIPVVRNNDSSHKTPNFLGPRLFIDFTHDSEYDEKLEELLRELHGVPLEPRPPIGDNPYSGTPPAESVPVRVTGQTGRTTGGEALLDDQWFEDQTQSADSGIQRVGLEGHMEVRCGLHDLISVSQIELLDAVRSSEIRTFGWPIAVLLENRDEFRPRPFNDGIRAEVAFGRDSGIAGTDRNSYDYWALRSGGDFFLLQSLFEDERAENKIFFNTRIVRVAETFMFAHGLYKTLGASDDAQLSVRIRHRGLAGRELTASTPNRPIIPATAQESVSQAELVLVVGNLRRELVQNVQKILKPMFMLFDFRELNDSIYENIVTRFERGDVS